MQLSETSTQTLDLPVPYPIWNGIMWLMTSTYFLATMRLVSKSFWKACNCQVRTYWTRKFGGIMPDAVPSDSEQQNTMQKTRSRKMLLNSVKVSSRFTNFRSRNQYFKWPVAKSWPIPPPVVRYAYQSSRKPKDLMSPCFTFPIRHVSSLQPLVTSKSCMF